MTPEERNHHTLRMRENWYRDVWLLLVTGLVLVALLAQHDTSNQRRTDQQKLNTTLATTAKNQLLNRGANVEVWCDADNEQNSAAREFVKRVSRGTLVYPLENLPCEALIRETLESSKHPSVITKKDNPVTYRIAKELKVGP